MAFEILMKNRIFTDWSQKLKSKISVIFTKNKFTQKNDNLRLFPYTEIPTTSGFLLIRELFFGKTYDISYVFPKTQIEK